MLTVVKTNKMPVTIMAEILKLIMPVGCEILCIKYLKHHAGIKDRIYSKIDRQHKIAVQ
jgi:hypothetical protein